MHTHAEVSVSFEEKEYTANEGSTTTVCLIFEETVQRSFEANVTKQPLISVIEGKSKKYSLHCLF